MPSANSESWVRDQVADENPNLSRKRQRLSEEADDTSPLSTTDDSVVVVEALPPDSDESNTSIGSGIESYHGSTTMALFSDSFQLDARHKLTPVEQLTWFIGEVINSDKYLDARLFIELAAWIHDHTETVPHDQPKLSEAYLDADIEFFSKLGTLCYQILSRGHDLLEPQNVANVGTKLVQDHVVRLCNGTMALGLRLLNYLPGLVDATVDRRDSAQAAKPRQSIELLSWVQVLAHHLVPYRAAGLQYFKNIHCYKPKGAATRFKTIFMEARVPLSTMLSLLDKLGRHYEEVANSWDVMHAVLHVVNCLDLGDLAPESEVIMATAHNSLLPRICAKHPRALPEGFHDLLIVTASQALQELAKSTSSEKLVTDIYHSYIKGEDDALLLDAPSAQSTFASLLEVSNHDREVLAENLTAAWQLHAYRSYIYSDIMDIRTVGINGLGQRLVGMYNAHYSTKDNKETADHPVLRFVAKYLRVNELTKYIFGPNSHASLVSYSQKIVGFLAATSSYTNADTDIIWRACTNSVESDFVKASFAVLADICRFLDLDHLLYLAQKYATTPAAKLGKDAVESLADLLQRVHYKRDQTDNQEQLLATAFISIEIMKRTSGPDSHGAIGQLRDVARNELSHFTTSHFGADYRTAIFKRCVPDIIDKTEAATTSIEIMHMFLRNPCSQKEFDDLVAMLPAAVAIEELEHSVNIRRNASCESNVESFFWLETRFEAILFLMCLPGPWIDDDHFRSALRVLYASTVGDRALNNAARDTVWQLLTTWSSTGQSAPMPKMSKIASQMLERFLDASTTGLPVRYVTTRLMHLFTRQLPVSGPPNGDIKGFDELLESSVWKKLVEIAEATPPVDVTDMAVNTICQLLFELPTAKNGDDSVAKCQTEFTRRQVQHICDHFTSLPDSPSEMMIATLVQKIGLLDSVVRKAKHTATAPGHTVTPDITISSTAGSLEANYTLQLYSGGQSEAKIYRLRASTSATVDELAAQLPSISGAGSNRIIIGGKLLDLVSCKEKLLSEVGLQPSGVISICPTHTVKSDLRKVLTSPGAVEQEVLEQFDVIEQLLTGPDAIAAKVYSLLINIPSPAQARARVTSGDASVDDVFTPKYSWRAAYYLHVLQQHLVDFARLGVADGEFISQGIRTLVSLLNDPDCASRVDLCIQTLGVLITFLQESPVNSSTYTAFSEPENFTNRLIEICRNALKRSHTETTNRQRLVNFAHAVLHQAFRRQLSVWQSFTAHEHAYQLYADMLFDADLPLAVDCCFSIGRLCMDPSSPPEFPDFYMHVILGAVPQALGCRDRATLFFDMATTVLGNNTLLHGDEARVRDVTNTIVSTLWAYEHCESVDLPILDTTFVGLVRLLSALIGVLKSFKKPLELGSLPTELVDKLLFPKYKSPQSRPLVHPQSRQLVYSLVKSVCEGQVEYTGIVQSVIDVLSDATNNPTDKYPGVQQWARPATICAGLENLGMTCYMNSLLQQLFANVQFRKFLLQVRIADPEKQMLLVEVQKLFARMQDFYMPAIDTTPLARVLNIQTDSQEDVHGFYADLLSKLESNMPDHESKMALSKYFSGKLITQVKGECGHVSPNTEPFVDLPMVVKNKASLFESLDEFVQGEPMEGANQYRCQACDQADGGRLVNAMRRSCPEDMPDNLIFCLKRFTFEAMVGLEGKVNERFEFPQTIDMARYHREQLEDPASRADPDVFELVGVIVHQGTLQMGHYWSYTLLRSTGDPNARTWAKLEDKNANLVQNGIAEVSHECFGGLRYPNGFERADNAYVLLYQRKSSLEEQIATQSIAQDCNAPVILPPKVDVPPALADEIHGCNAWRTRVAHLFDPELVSLVEWLLVEAKHFGFQAASQFARASASPENLADNGHESKESVGAVDPAPSQEGDSDAQDLPKILARLAMTYVQRIGVCAQLPNKTLPPVINALKQLMEGQPRIAFYALDQLASLEGWLYGFMGHDNKGVRTLVIDFIWYCLDIVKHRDSASCHEVLGRIRRTLARHLGTGSDIGSINWTDFLGFVSNIAAESPAQTAATLDEGYWLWAADMIALPHDGSLRKKYPGLAELIKTRTDQAWALYQFIHDLLDEDSCGHVQVSSLEEFSPEEGPRTVTSDGVLLKRSEMLMFFPPDNAQKIVAFWLQSAKYADRGCSYKDSAPGRLLALLVDRAAPELLAPIAQSLVLHVDVEEESLSSLLNITTHYVAATEQSEEGNGEVAKQLFRQLLKTIPMWKGHEGELNVIISEAYQAAPKTILATLDEWAGSYLVSKASQVRKDTAKFLIHVFDAESDLTKPMIEVLKCNQARRMVAQLGPYLRQAYEEEKPKARWEALIEVFMRIHPYLQDLRDAISRTSNKKSLPAALMVEYDEAKTSIADLQDLGEAIDGWESVPGIQDEAGVRKSVELVSEDSDEEDWDSDSSSAFR